MLFLACAALAASPARAQRREAFRVGWLSVTANPQIESFRAGMRALGYTEGNGLVIEARDAGGDVAKLHALAGELGRLGMDVVVTVGIYATQAARDALPSTPVVFVSNDSVGQGLVQSRARPGGALTGMELMSDDISTKWLELLAEFLPQATRFVALRAATSNLSQVAPLPGVGASIGKPVTVIDVRASDDYLPAFQAAVRMEAQGMIVLSSAVFHGHRQRIVDLAARFRLPAIYEHRDFPTAGGLISYGPDVRELFTRLASYVDRIFNGAKPADLPVERPTRFELVINLATAKALALVVPPSLLARADEVIE